MVERGLFKETDFAAPPACEGGPGVFQGMVCIQG